MDTSTFATILRKLHSRRGVDVYNACIEIRKNVIKSPRGVAKLVRDNAIPILLGILRRTEQPEEAAIEEPYRSKVKDVACSILGNVCMDTVAREQVLKHGGAALICEILCSTEIESLQNRCCRCVANMCLSPSAWKLIHSTDAIERIVKLLKETENADCQQTYIRAVRLLGQTRPCVQKLLDFNAVSAVMKYIDSEHSQVSRSALTCVTSLTVHGNTIQFASQVVSSGKIGHLISVAKDTELESSQDALLFLINLSEHHNFRPAFGNAGGISLFTNFMKVEDFTGKEKVVSVLCLCCKEAVNRVKLREDGVLKLFITYLKDDSYKTLHLRIVSALVCFLYDETSFDTLLDNGLVPVLIHHLRSYLDEDSVTNCPTSVRGACSSTDSNTTNLSSHISSQSASKKADCEEMGENKLKELEKKNKGEKSKELGSDKTEELGKIEVGEMGNVKDKLKELEKKNRGEKSKELGSDKTVELGKVEVGDMGNVEAGEMREVKAEEMRGEKCEELGSDKTEEFGKVEVGEMGNVKAGEMGKGKAEEMEIDKTGKVKSVSNDDMTKTRRKITTRERDNDMDISKIARQNDNESATNKNKPVEDDSERETTTSQRDLGEMSMETNDVETLMTIEQSIGSDDPLQLSVPCPDSKPTTSRNTKVYSMDSPTYQMVSESFTETEYSSGAKCKKSFSPHSALDKSSEAYSPISNVSYYSPLSSPNYSPLSDRRSPVVMENQPVYSGLESPAYEGVSIPGSSSACRRLDLDSEGSSTGEGIEGHRWLWSPGESQNSDSDSDTETNCVDTNLNEMKNTVQSSESSSQAKGTNSTSFLTCVRNEVELVPLACEDAPECVDSRLAPDTLEKKIDEGCSDFKKKEFIDPIFSGEEIMVVDDSYSEEQNVQKACKKRKKSDNSMENSILILLSRVSQMTNPTLHFVSTETISCLLDYIIEMEAPLARAARLLSRVFRNPHCFMRLLMLKIPVIIYEKLLGAENIPSVLKRINQLKREEKTVSSGFRSRSSSISSGTSDSDRFSLFEERSDDEGYPSKRQRLSGSSEWMKREIKGFYHKQEEEVCDAGKCGISFLEDISGVAESPYGRGVVEKLVKQDDQSRDNACLSVLFLCRNQGAIDVFNRLDIFNSVITMLEEKQPYKFKVIVQGLSLIAHLLNFRTRFQSSREESSPKISLEKTASYINSLSRISLVQKMDENEATKLEGTGATRGQFVYNTSKSSPVTPRMAKSPWSFGHSECDRAKNSCTYQGLTHISSSCVLSSCHTCLNKDVTFLVKGEKFAANRNRLSKSSEMLAAMLEGHYTESCQSEIELPHTSKFAFRYILHYLHGCKAEGCNVVDFFSNCEVLVKSSRRLLKVLREADKYLLHELKSDLASLLYDKYIVPSTAFDIFEYAVMYDNFKVQKAAVSCLLVDARSTNQLLFWFQKFLSSKFVGVFMNTLTDLMLD